MEVIRNIYHYFWGYKKHHGHAPPQEPEPEPEPSPEPEPEPTKKQETRRHPRIVRTGKIITFCFIILIGFDFVMTYGDLVITRYLSNNEFSFVSRHPWLIRFHQIKTWTFFVSLFAIVVAGLTDSFTTLTTTTIVGIGVTLVMFLLAFLAEFTTFPGQSKAIIFLIGKYFTVFTLIFLPIRTVLILEQIILPEDLWMLRMIIAIFIWLRQVDTILVALVPEIVENEKTNLLINVLCLPLVVTFGILIILFHKHLVKYNKINSFSVYKCICKINLRHRKKVNREKAWTEYTQNHSPLIRQDTEQFLLLVFWLTPFVAYFVLEQLVYQVWDVQVKLIELPEDSLFPRLSLKVILAVLNMINIPLLELLFHFCKDTKLLHHDLQRMCIGFSALACSAFIALGFEFMSSTVVPEGSAQLNLYNTMDSIVMIDSVWTGEQSMDPGAQMSFPVSGLGDLHTMANISNESDGFLMREIRGIAIGEMRKEYSKTIFAREDAAVFYVISNLGIIRITGFEDRESEGLDEPDLGVTKVIVMSTIYWKVILDPYIQLGNRDPIWLTVPFVTEKEELIVNPGQYTISVDSAGKKQESHLLSPWVTYVIVFFIDSHDRIDFRVFQTAAITPREKYDFPIALYFALYFFSLAICTHIICLKSLTFLESPVDMRCTSFAMLQFSEVFGSSIFFVLNWMWKSRSFKFLTCLCLCVYLVNIGLLVFVMKKFKKQKW